MDFIYFMHISKSFPYYNSIVCQRIAAGQWFSLDTPISFTNKTDGRNIVEILLKAALNTIITLQYHFIYSRSSLNVSSVKWKEYNGYFLNVDLCTAIIFQYLKNEFQRKMKENKLLGMNSLFNHILNKL